MKFDRVIVSEKSHKSTDDPYAIVHSNLTVVNLLRDEGVANEALCEEALMSYFVDYYLAQCNNGGLSQFVYNSRWRSAVVGYVREGLKRMAEGTAGDHLAVFQALAVRVDSLGNEKLGAFHARDYFSEEAKGCRDLLNDPTFFDVNRQEDLLALNAKWLRRLPNLHVLSIDGMFEEIERTLGRKVSRA